jgi:hypothetical protein
MTTRGRAAAKPEWCPSVRRKGTTLRRRGFVGPWTIAAKYPTNSAFYDGGTLLIEFARGQSDGFRASLERFHSDILTRAAILYINVSFDESYRRNSARYKKGQEESVLFHKVPDRDMFGFFRHNDWDEMTAGRLDGWLELAGARVPFVSMLNEPESSDPGVLRERYARALNCLMDLYRTR